MKRCSKKGCNGLVYPEPDYSKPVEKCVRHDKSFIMAYPFKEIEEGSLCYFHRTFPNYPLPEPFEPSRYVDKWN